MILVLTNDDGIDAPGIQALQGAVEGKGIIVAPKEHHSGCSHQVTTDRPIPVVQRTETEYAIGGTPADCSRLAVSHLCREIDWLLSGINAGGNLGTDAYISGTVAAVREAAMQGISGIAVSHWIKRPLIIDWDWATYWTKKVLADLFPRPLPPGSFWNVNLPHLESGSPDPKIVFCPQSKEPLPLQYRVEGNSYQYEGVYEKRDRTSGSDVDICFSGNIAITQMSV
ncbi:MAG: 5'/3'-nucleotidase SurE [Spirulinaceae cyanobacterium]